MHICYLNVYNILTLEFISVIIYIGDYMKKIKYFILALMLVPAITFADTKESFDLNTSDNIDEEISVNGSKVTLGNNVISKNNVSGIELIFSNNLNHASTSDYALLFGNTVTLNSNIKNDGFVFGNIVSFNDSFKIQRDLFVFAYDVTLKGEVTRDLKIYASSVNIDNAKIGGNVTIYANEIKLNNTHIEGSLTYNEDASYDSNSLIVKGDVKKEAKIIEKQNVILEFIYSYIDFLALFLILALIVPALFNKIEEKTSDFNLVNVLSTIGYGMVALILIPIVSILLLASNFMTFVALLLLVLFILAIFASTIITGYFIGSQVLRKVIKKDLNILIAGLIGITIIKLLTLIPVVGSIILLLNILISLGIIIKLFIKS